MTTSDLLPAPERTSTNSAHLGNSITRSLKTGVGTARLSGALLFGAADVGRLPRYFSRSGQNTSRSTLPANAKMKSDGSQKQLR